MELNLSDFSKNRQITGDFGHEIQCRWDGGLFTDKQTRKSNDEFSILFCFIQPVFA